MPVPGKVRTVNAQSFDNHKTSASHGLHFGRTPTLANRINHSSPSHHEPHGSLHRCPPCGWRIPVPSCACESATDRKGAPVFRETMSGMRVVARADLHQHYAQEIVLGVAATSIVRFIKHSYTDIAPVPAKAPWGGVLFSEQHLDMSHPAIHNRRRKMVCNKHFERMPRHTLVRRSVRFTVTPPAPFPLPSPRPLSDAESTPWDGSWSIGTGSRLKTSSDSVFWGQKTHEYGYFRCECSKRHCK